MTVDIGWGVGIIVSLAGGFIVILLACMAVGLILAGLGAIISFLDKPIRFRR